MKLFFSFFLFFTMSILYSQSGRAIFKKEYIIPKDRFDKIKKENPERYQELIAFNRKIVAAAKQVEFEMIFSNKKARFEAIEMLSTANIDSELGVGPNAGVFYTNLDTQEQLWSTGAYFGQDFIIALEAVDWDLTNQTKTIGGYQCRKAIGTKTTYGRKGKVEFPIEAWFTMDIPVSFGPLGYSGLPGFIVNLMVQNERYYLKQLNLTEDKFNIKRPEKGKEITYEEFYEILSGVRNNMKSNR